MKNRRNAWLWSCYWSFVVASLAGLTWITLNAVRWAKERQRFQTEQARLLIAAHEANVALEKQQKISEALWAADSITAPLLAIESAQPIRNYTAWTRTVTPPQPSSPDASAPNVVRELPSPLLMQRSPIALLHFQYSEQEVLSSPQVPERTTWAKAQALGIADHCLEEDESRLKKLTESPPFIAAMKGLLQDDPVELTTGHLASSGIGSNVISPNGLGFNMGNFLVDKELPSVESLEEISNGYQSSSRQARGDNQQLRNRAQSFNIIATNSAYGQQQVAQESFPSAFGPTIAPQFTIRFLWINNDLFHVRKFRNQQGVTLQGCWIDWPTLEKWLLPQLSPILPGVRLVAVDPNAESSSTIQQMANLPIRLEWNEGDEVVTRETKLTSLTNSSQSSRSITQEKSESWYSILLWPLGMTWTVWIAAVIASGGLLRSILQLAERRATFVSAVTHELRTPLTTFRLYTDLLASEKKLEATQQRNYVKTLQGQAERLSRLVENVLAFSRLDGSTARPAKTPYRIQELVDSMRGRLDEVVARYDAQLHWNYESMADMKLETNLEVMEQIFVNLVENSCKYGLTRESRTIEIDVQKSNERMAFHFIDHGLGIDPELRGKLFQPFSRSAEQAAGKAPGIGLGLSLARRLAAQIGGRLSLIESRQGLTQFALAFEA